MDSFIVDRDAPRLDVWLAEASGRPRSEIQKLIAAGLVTVDGATSSKSSSVHPGQTVSVGTAPPPKIGPADFEVPVRYEDEHLAVVMKPAGAVVHRTPGDLRATVVDVLSSRMPLAAASGPDRPGIVHRLDKDTSGLMVVAKTDESCERLSRMIKERLVSRHYDALVSGTFVMPTGKVQAPIERSKRDPTKMVVDPSGKPSVTSFRVAEALGAVSLLAVTLETGRMHQIRVHMAHIKHPVIGDRVYGPATMPAAASLGLTRPFLHAARLAFTHPVTGELIDLSEPLPADLDEAIARARSIPV